MTRIQEEDKTFTMSGKRKNGTCEAHPDEPVVAVCTMQEDGHFLLCAECATGCTDAGHVIRTVDDMEQVEQSSIDEVEEALPRATKLHAIAMQADQLLRARCIKYRHEISRRADELVALIRTQEAELNAGLMAKADEMGETIRNAARDSREVLEAIEGRRRALARSHGIHRVAAYLTPLPDSYDFKLDCDGMIDLSWTCDPIWTVKDATAQPEACELRMIKAGEFEITAPRAGLQFESKCEDGIPVHTTDNGDGTYALTVRRDASTTMYVELRNRGIPGSPAVVPGKLSWSHENTNVRVNGLTAMLRNLHVRDCTKPYAVSNRFFSDFTVKIGQAENTSEEAVGFVRNGHIETPATVFGINPFTSLQTCTMGTFVVRAPVDSAGIVTVRGVYDEEADTIQFYVNGVTQGITYTNVPRGDYRAAVLLHPAQTVEFVAGQLA